MKLLVITPILNTLIGFIIGGLCTTTVKLFKIVKQKEQEDRHLEEVVLQAVKALTHDSFFRYCRYLLKEGYVTTETLENLEHLYQSYKELGMNGTGDKLMAECRQLPIKS